MAINYFFGMEREWLEKELQLCREDISRGKTLIQWGAGDSSGISKVQLTPQQRFEYLWAELSRQFPDDYPATNLRVRRTTPRYIYGS